MLQLLFLLILKTGFSQQVYEASDYASPGDSFRVSIATSGLAGFNLYGGTNASWDYDSLPVSSQRDIRWINAGDGGYKNSWCLSKGIILGCNAQFNNLTNQATYGLDSIQIGSLGLSNLVEHYRKTSGALEFTMLGATVDLGSVPVRVPVEYAIPDTIFKFPITVYDTTTTKSNYKIDLNSLGVNLIYVSHKTRTNSIDSWGALTTPYGTFDSVVQVFTVIETRDTTFTASSTIPRETTNIVYTWFDQQFGIPVLEVEATVIAGNTVITRATYIDSARCVAPYAFYSYAPLVPYYDSVSRSAPISFKNLSTNADSSYWDFGDGSTSTSRSPNHTYNCPGVYPVTLVVFNKNCNPYEVDSFKLPIVIIDTTLSLSTGIFDTILKGEQLVFGPDTLSDPGIYYDTIITANGCDSIIELLLTVECATQDIPVNAGWNMISSHIIPDNPDMLDVIDSISDDILLIKNVTGETAIPSLSINTIGDWNVLEGYKAKASNPTNVTLGCTITNPATPLALPVGWSILSYLPLTSLDASVALAGISSDIILAKDIQGNTYIPSLSINTIGDLEPGQGYQIKMSNPATLYYPGD